MEKIQELKPIITSLLYLLSSIVIFTLVVFAWFTITNVSDVALISEVASVEAEYKFFVYLDEDKNGNPTDPVLTGNTCDQEIDACYLNIPDPTSAHLIPDRVAPGDRFSFAIEITNVGDEAALNLQFGELVSSGFDIEENRIQVAFRHQVQRITYRNDGSETADIKDEDGITYADNYFTFDNSDRYVLVDGVPLSAINEDDSTVIVYFDLFFDPDVYGQTPEGEPQTNSNAFIDQTFTISHIHMSLET